VTMSLQLLEDELAEGDVEPETRRMLMARALSGAQRMRTTIIGLMDFAVLGGHLAPARLDSAAIVADVLADLSSRQGRVEVEVGPLPQVWGDDVQIRAVVQNLVANAFKYAGHVEHPLVRISGSTYDGGTRIVVADNGPGVPPDQRHAVFDLMVRGEGAAESGVDGLGIGLDTCRRIVNAHGGNIGVDEAPSGGAEFWFALPEPAEVRLVAVRPPGQVEHPLQGDLGPVLGVGVDLDDVDDLSLHE
jgi:signal transduction histidine kinase